MFREKMKNLFKLPKRSKKTLLLIAATAAITILTSTLIATWLSKTTNLKVPSLGTIITLDVEVYWDQFLTNKTETFNWGTIYPGSSQNVSLYIETTLNLNTTNWNPTYLSDYMNLTWNYNGTIIHPGDVIQVTLTLSACSSSSFLLYLITNDVKQFSFDIVISTQEYS